MNVRAIAAVMIHVPDWKGGLDWYQKAFPQAHRIRSPEFDFEFLELNEDFDCGWRVRLAPVG